MIKTVHFLCGLLHTYTLVMFMYRFEIKGMTFGVSFSFLALVGFLSLCGGQIKAQLAMCLLCCAFHELGHFAAMLLLGVRPQALILYGGGILIKRKQGIDSSNLTDCVILLAGPLANAMLALLLSLVGLKAAAGYNLFCAVFNLLPFAYFDGGRVASALFPGSAAVGLVKNIIILMFACLVFSVTLMGGLNISLLVTFVYIAVCEVLE
ncbi:MAG: peptidase M50 [Ruminococcus sp.]|nr:peptidase M50 [Ruminococcus sp.]